MATSVSKIAVACPSFQIFIILYYCRYAEKVNKKLREKHSQYNISEDVLNEAIAIYSKDAGFAKSLQQLNEKHEEA